MGWGAEDEEWSTARQAEVKARSPAVRRFTKSLEFSSILDLREIDLWAVADSKKKAG